jgi:hypothetical protein
VTTVRSSAIAVALVAPVLFIGCLDVVGCWGDARWTEPGLSAWLETHGRDAGFGPGPPPPGLPLGPKVAAALPDGAEVDSLWYLPDDRKGIHIDFRLWEGNVSVSAWSLHSDEFDPPPTEEVVTVLDEALDGIYRGDAAARAKAVQQVRTSWPLMERGAWMEVDLELAGPWDLEAIFPEGTTFASERSFHSARVGDWHIDARSTYWMHNWEGLHSMEVDADDRVFLAVSQMDYARDVKEFINESLPQRAWTFTDFEYDTSCVPGPVF